MKNKQNRTKNPFTHFSFCAFYNTLKKKSYNENRKPAYFQIRD